MRLSLSVMMSSAAVLSLAGCESSLFKSVTKKFNESVATKVTQEQVVDTSKVSAPLQAVAKTEIASDTGLALQRVELGQFPCADKTFVRVSEDKENLGIFVVENGSKKYNMKLVVTKSGAIRLEDTASGVIWLQVATKSMLMNEKQGQRLADSCVSPKQVAFNAAYQPPAAQPPIIKPNAPVEKVSRNATNSKKAALKGKTKKK